MNEFGKVAFKNCRKYFTVSFAWMSANKVTVNAIR